MDLNDIRLQVLRLAVTFAIEMKETKIDWYDVYVAMLDALVLPKDK